MKALLPIIIASLIGFSGVQAYAQAAQPSKQMEEFLSSEQEAQENFVANGVLMIGVVASQTAPKIAQCLDDWYNASPDLRRQRDKEVIDTMRQLPQYTPATIVLAVVEKACGKFKREPM
jgi:hypothetical protein